MQVKDKFGRVLALKERTAFRQPRVWDVHLRYAVLAGGRTVEVEANSWLLELGEASTAGKTDYLYRLASGQTVALDRELADDEVIVVKDPQALAAMQVFRTPQEALWQDRGVDMQYECNHLPPFALIRCPLCSGADFVSIEAAAVWCEGCNARFRVRSTAGDPGFVVDCSWEHYFYLSARYILPRSRNLSLSLVFKNAGDPRDLSHDPQGGCWGPAGGGKCRPDRLWLTDGRTGLRAGLHLCNSGDLYDWSLVGLAPTLASLGRDLWGVGWEIDGQRWPNCATVRSLALEPDERDALRRAAYQVRSTSPNTADRLCALADAPSTPRAVVMQNTLPPVSGLQDGQYYLLYRWAVAASKRSVGEGAWPVWHVVRPVMHPERPNSVAAWEVLRRNICLRCHRPVRPEELGEPAEGDERGRLHDFCRAIWQVTGWRPQFAEPGEKESADDAESKSIQLPGEANETQATL